MKYIYLILGLFLISACSQTASTLTDHAMNAMTTKDDLSKGKKLYETNCVQCHELKDPAKFSANQLMDIVPDMVGRAKLDKDSGKAILDYMLSASKATK